MAKDDSYLDAMRNRPFTKVEQAEIDCFCKAYGHDVKSTDKEGATLLHEAAGYWDVAVVRFLISQGADVHAEDEYGFTPLMSAIAENAHGDVWFYLYYETTGGRYHPEGDPHEDLIAFAKEMGNKEVAKYLTTWVNILKSMVEAKDHFREILDMGVNAKPDSSVAEWWRESGKGMLTQFESFSYFVELTPEEMDVVRRAKDKIE
jgi:hypothetical protein